MNNNVCGSVKANFDYIFQLHCHFWESFITSSNFHFKNAAGLTSFLLMFLSICRVHFFVNINIPYNIGTKGRCNFIKLSSENCVFKELWNRTNYIVILHKTSTVYVLFFSLDKHAQFSLKKIPLLYHFLKNTLLSFTLICELNETGDDNISDCIS